MFFSRPSPKAGRELQTEHDTFDEGRRTLSEKSAGAGARDASLAYAGTWGPPGAVPGGHNYDRVSDATYI